ncbi:J domain-containing protein [Pseudomonas citronellolis]|uniref:J domain-containing protein n=1 Tax=Pseudomonas citronellolis TaxID=53408 RepID=UPI0023E3EE34|nr:hypothetical protein [Pseudomonas citronellolis]MDF3932078.1 hypothetical protein [Pseudomonas citronellolis]
MSCWEILGLDAEADERSIKRQYARLLKVTRPDEDAQAFQALREAYEQALNWVRWHVEEAADEQPAPLVQPSVQPLVPPFERGAEQPVELPVQLQLQPLLEGIAPSTLSERRQRATEAGLAAAFERALLQLCLDGLHGHELLDAACTEFAWLEVDRCSALSEDECLKVRARLLRGRMQQLRVFFDEGRLADFEAGLAALRRLPWLQSYDARALLDEAVVELMLEVTWWPEGAFCRVASQFGWQEGKHVPNCAEHLWNALLQRRDAQSYFETLQSDARTWDLRPEQRAARLMLTPFDLYQRRRFSADFGAADWTCCQRIADTLQYRYPHLLQHLPDGQRDPGFWRDLPRAEAGWNVRFFILWMIVVMVLGLFWLPGKASSLAELLPNLLTLAVFSTIPFGVSSILLRVFRALTGNRLNRFDYWLSGVLLPARWHEQGAGMRPLRHGALAAGAGVLVALTLGLKGSAFWLACVPLTVLALGAMYLEMRTHVLALGAETILAPVRRHFAVILTVGLVAIFLAVIGIQVYLQQQQLIRSQYFQGRTEQERCRDPEHSRELTCILSWRPHGAN